jgi:hypothetical protein
MVEINELREKQTSISLQLNDKCPLDMFKKLKDHVSKMPDNENLSHLRAMVGDAVGQFQKQAIAYEHKF